MNNQFSIHVDAAQWRPYLQTEWQLIPLHRHDSESKKSGRTILNGKRPQHFNWTKRIYGSKAVARRCANENRNIGIRLTAQQLVIDVDVRHGGEESFFNLCIELGLDDTQWPRVITGGGGSHFYLRLPDDLVIVDTLKTYPGIEFKSLGRQVVGAGSVHPETKQRYRWDESHPPLANTPEAPADLIKLIQRPLHSSSVTSGGQYDQEHIAAALEGVDVTQFQDQTEWFKFMCACHHASGGHAREEFITWSTSDPMYADDAEIIGRRWDSLHSDKPNAITFRTFNKILADHGVAHLQVPLDASDDFDALEDEEPSEFAWLEGGEQPSEEEKTMLQQLNETYCAVTTGGKYRITYQAHTQTGTVWETMNKTDFQSLHENQTVVSPRDPNKTISLGVAWQQWVNRRTASGTTFNTCLPPGALDEQNRLNLWLGWMIEPKPGDWHLFKAMIRDDVCAGDKGAFDYFMKWIAWTFQNPGALPETALAMRGNKGTGKSTLGHAIARCYGSHAMCTSQMDHIAGRFNGHMEYNLFTYADEAFWAGDPRQEAQIKKLITDARTMYEHKGVTPYPGVNRTSLMFGSNDEWVVPATEGERRYCVVRTSDKHKCPEGDPDHPNRPYWAAIYAQLENGGLAGFLHDMLHAKLPAGWHPRGHVPVTEELANQKARGFKGLVGFYFERLQTGTILETLDGTNTDWETGALCVRPTEFWEGCQAWIHTTNPRAVLTRRSLIDELKRFGWDAGEHLRHGKQRERYWLCPDLPTARARFNTIMNGSFFES